MSFENKKNLLRALLIGGAFPLIAVVGVAEESTVEQKVPAPQEPVHIVEGEDLKKEAPAAVKSVCYPYIGVALETLPAATLCENTRPGIQVVYVQKGSPAEQVGIKAGDILVLFEDQKLFFPNQFSSLIRSYKPGDKIELTIVRGDTIVKKTPVIGERRIEIPAPQPPKKTEIPKDDVRIYINGREYSLADGVDLGEWITLTPRGILIRDTLNIPAEFRNFVSRVHSKLPDSKKMLSSLRKQYDEARAAAVGKACHTFSQVFFGNGNSVIIVGNEKSRQITVSRSNDDSIIFRGPCTTQADIDAIPEEAKKIIEYFTILKPMEVAEPVEEKK